MGTKPMVVDGWIDLRIERIDSTVGWMIGLEVSVLVSFDMVDMEAGLFLLYRGDDDVSCRDLR